MKSHHSTSYIIHRSALLRLIRQYNFGGRSRLHRSLRLNSHFHTFGFSNHVILQHMRDWAVRLCTGMRQNVRKNLDIGHVIQGEKSFFFFFQFYRRGCSSDLFYCWYMTWESARWQDLSWKICFTFWQVN